MQQFTNAKGLSLASYIFPAKGDAKALVILVHGHGCRSLFSSMLFNVVYMSFMESSQLDSGYALLILT